MEQFWLAHRNGILAACILGAIFSLGLAEIFRPRRTAAAAIPRRWTCNLLIAGTNQAVAILLLRGSAVALAAAIAAGPRSLRFSALPAFATIPITILLMDLLRYGQHRLYHAIPALWRVHQLHHSDSDCDFTTGLRFHPFETILTFATDLIAVFVLGPPVLGVLALEAATALQDLFEHANIALPAWVDAMLRRLVITPDMHRIHHSIRLPEQNRNFGVIFPWWDRLFGTYLQDPALGQTGMRVGLQGALISENNVVAAMALPFRKQ